jgi:hypothetical protein
MMTLNFSLESLAYSGISLGKLSGTPDGNAASLRMVEYLKIPHEHGDCVVLVLAHPGVNLLGRYLPTHKVNDLLLVESIRTRTISLGDFAMEEAPNGEGLLEIGDDMEGYDIMDLASFLEYVQRFWLQLFAQSYKVCHSGDSLFRSFAQVSP